MSKKKKRNTAVSNVNIVLSESLSKEEMKNILVEAMLEVEKRKAEAEQQVAEKELREWRNNLGIRDYSDEERMLVRKLKQFLNTFFAFLDFLLYQKTKSRVTELLLVC